ncbi:hypothetical protein [Mycobacterium sp. GA-1199]|uniref:hypothetical protein n=1 Tax=Mycobacterium sp. GA-1199 TaxID=1772287 RepID=UPI000B26D35D|nr:hypothetical protein [Mycobacterium sp. GA-1199]
MTTIEPAVRYDPIDNAEHLANVMQPETGKPRAEASSEPVMSGDPQFGLSAKRAGK